MLSWDLYGHCSLWMLINIVTETQFIFVIREVALFCISLQPAYAINIEKEYLCQSKESHLLEYKFDYWQGFQL